jgi:hypothetical protein
MDEERLLRDVLAEPEAPDRRTVADARARLERLTRTEVRRNKTNHLRLGIIAIVAAAGVVGASLVPQLIPALDQKPEVAAQHSATPAVPTRPPSKAPLPKAKSLLDKAATYEAARSKPAGYYWRLRTLTSTKVVVAGKTPYSMALLAVTEHWAGGEGHTATGLRVLSLRAASQADAQAHSKNGSPTHVKVRLSDLPKPSPTFALELPDKGRLTGDSTSYFGTLELSDVAWQKLTSRPESLVDALLALRDPSTKGDPNAWLFAALSELVADSPANPALRATAFKALSALPGVTVEGVATDLNGRIGIALGHAKEGARLQLDPKTGAVQGLRKANGVRVAVLDSRWVDNKPSPPEPLDIPLQAK